jgi:chromosome partitioning protein
MLKRAAPRTHAKVLAIVTQKGGVAKTTTAFSLAIAAQRAGLAVTIVDTDKQASCQFLASIRKEQHLVQQASPELLAIGIEALDRVGCDLIIIDTPPHANDISALAIGQADFVLIPTNASVLSLKAATETIAQCRAQNKPFGILITQCQPQQGELFQRTRKSLENLGSEVCPIIMHRYVAHEKAQMFGQTAQEYDPDSTAAVEVAQIYKYVCKHLGLTRTNQRRVSA